MDPIDVVTALMTVAARTAPKATGQDYVVVEVLKGDVLKKLGVAMAEYGVHSGKKNFDRDGRNVQNSQAVVLIGIRDAKVCGLDCAACGFESCPPINTVHAEFAGPNCAMRVLDMGIALGSAVKTAGLLNVDNRIMYRIGVLARRLGLIEADLVMGIPLSVTGKSPYFDR